VVHQGALEVIAILSANRFGPGEIWIRYAEVLLDDRESVADGLEPGQSLRQGQASSKNICADPLAYPADFLELRQVQLGPGMEVPAEPGTTFGAVECPGDDMKQPRTGGQESAPDQEDDSSTE
jgi:hypothetical protein